jgi:3-hydroxyacyl-[acyl-carrier-protein] dehydratase
MAPVTLSPGRILELIPQREPFRFVDEILSVNEEKICGGYTFPSAADFYRGHFPGKPVTPGVILLESMCQVGVVALGIYLLAREEGVDAVARSLTMFSDAQVEFFQPVFPGEKVRITGERVFWRRKKLRSRIEMFDSGGKLVAACTASGMGVKNEF